MIRVSRSNMTIKKSCVLIAWLAPAALVVASCQTPGARNTTPLRMQKHDARDLLDLSKPVDAKRVEPADFVTAVRQATGGDEWAIKGYDIKADANGYLAVSASADMHSKVGMLLRDIRKEQVLSR